jgi:hypothetical protein
MLTTAKQACGKGETIMSTIETENQAGRPESEAQQPKGSRKPAKKAMPTKEAGRGKKTASTRGTERNKKAEVIAMMKRAKGATLAEIVKATGWQPHTIWGFVSILGSKGGEKIDSSKNAGG